MKKVWLLAGGSSLVVAALLTTGRVEAAACTAPTTDYGNVQSTVNITSPGTYRVWSRMAAPDTTNNTYLLEISGTSTGTNCYKVGGSSVPVYATDTNGNPVTPFANNTTNWMKTDLNTSSNIDVNFPAAGNFTVKMIGNAPDVLLDRVVFTQDTSCVPTGTGDNCASPPDTTPPTVSITAPANNATVSGTIAINATAADDTAVTKVEFLVDGVVKNTDMATPYTYNWDTTTATDGAHSLVAKAYDAALNVTASTAVNVTVSNGKPDLVVTGVSWAPASPATGNAVTFSATIKNQGTVATTAGTSHNTAFSVDGSVVANASTSTSLAAGASTTLNASSTWAATAGTHTILANVDSGNTITESNEANNTLSTSMVVSSPDTTPPTVSITAPANNATVSGTVAINATAADTGGSNLARVEFYVDGVLKGSDTASPYTYNWDTTNVCNTSHSLTAKAFDGAGNLTLSSAVTVTLNNSASPNPKPGDVDGNGCIGIVDLSTVLSHWNLSNPTRAQGDLNGDNAVNIIDLSIVLTNWGK